MLAAGGDYVFFTDADRAYGFEPIRRAMDIFEETGADAVIGTRSGTENGYGGYPFLRRTASRVHDGRFRFRFRSHDDIRQAGPARRGTARRHSQSQGFEGPRSTRYLQDAQRYI